MGKNIKKSIELNNIKFSFWILVFKMKNTENLTEEVLRCFLIMDPKGFEPSTSALRTLCSPN